MSQKKLLSICIPTYNRAEFLEYNLQSITSQFDLDPALLDYVEVVISDNVEIGALCAIDKGVSGDTFIGKGTKFDNQVQIGHDTRIGANCLIGSQSAVAGVTVIEDDVIIWAKVSVNKDLHVGKGAVILATSGVDKDLVGDKVYFGIPADEARKKWKEIAYTKLLPDFMESVKRNGHDKK